MSELIESDRDLQLQISLYRKLVHRARANQTKIRFSIQRTLIVKFPNVSIWAQHPVINRARDFIHALEKTRKVVIFHAGWVITKFFVIFTGWRNSIVFTPLLFETSIACAPRFYGSPRRLERALIYSQSAREVVISNLHSQIIGDFMVFESGIFISEGYWCIKFNFREVLQFSFINLDQN